MRRQQVLEIFASELVKQRNIVVQKLKTAIMAYPYIRKKLVQNILVNGESIIQPLLTKNLSGIYALLYQEYNKISLVGAFCNNSVVLGFRRLDLNSDWAQALIHTRANSKTWRTPLRRKLLDGWYVKRRVMVMRRWSWVIYSWRFMSTHSFRCLSTRAKRSCGFWLNSSKVDDSDIRSIK